MDKQELLMDTKRAIYANLRQLPWLNKIIIFTHMPKTGGVSVNTIVKKQYGAGRVLELGSKRPKDVLENIVSMSFWTILRWRVISGHMIWGIHEWLPKSFTYFTVLRNPIERILSTYSYASASPAHHLHNDMVRRNMSLEEFIVWDQAVNINNLQCKLLSGLDPYKENHMPTVLMQARYNLDHYCLVGLTERFKESLSIFSGLFGWRNVIIERQNVTPNRIKKKGVSPSTVRKIEEMNQYDLELYAFGQQLFAEQNRDIHSAFVRKTTR